MSPLSLERIRQSMTCTACAGVFWLAACAGTAPVNPDQEQSADSPRQASKAEQAATTPLNDLNLMRERIPQVLLRAQADPYGVPVDSSCQSLKGDIVALDAALPADVDVQGAVQRDGVLVFTPEDAVVYAIQGAVGGIIPFRSWVRKLSGAERRSKALAQALASGMARRSYLKGYARSMGCSWPQPLPEAACPPLSTADGCPAPATPAPALPPSSGDQPVR
jgi:hypothetical protein